MVYLYMSKKSRYIIHSEEIKTISKQLKFFRKKCGLTQKKLGEKIGVTQKTIAAYETGRIRINDVTIIRLANALNVSSDELLGINIINDSPKDLSFRILKRMNTIDVFPESTKKYIIRILDDIIKANQHA